MAEKTKFDSAPESLPGLGVMCCFNCVYAQHDTNLPLGTVATQQQFVKCVWGPPSVVVIPVGIDQVTGKAQMAIQSKFPVMGVREFCHRFETRAGA